MLSYFGRRISILLVLVALSIGSAIGIGGYTFFYAKGTAYLTNDPKACANCHVMEQHYSAWLKSSHRAVATCNDCHSPPGLIDKYWSKAQNGFWHSVKFTTGNYPDPLRIKPYNLEIVEDSCRKCHGAITDAIDPHTNDPNTSQMTCTHCHQGVGHPWRR